MEISILGPLEVVGRDGTVPLPRGRARALLAILALDVDRVVATDRLVDLLWGANPPATARTKLHGLVHALRAALAPAAEHGTIIATRSPGYALSLEAERVDAHRFARLVQQASARAAAAERVRLLQEALHLWRGPALADFTDERFAQASIISFDGARVTAVEECLAARLECGEHVAVAGEAQALVAQHPFRERLRELAMLAHYRCGDQRAALRLARETRELFAAELGVEPGPDLSALERAILRHDPALRTTHRWRAGTDPPPTDAMFTESLKTVTVLFVDVALPGGPGDDPETLQERIRRRHAAVQKTIAHHGGTVQPTLGGVTVAIFGLPVAHEDDALRAVRAAAEVASPAAAPTVRIGVSTGEIVVGEPLSAPGLSGLVPRTAAILQRGAPPGTVLVSDATRRLIGAAAELQPWPSPLRDDAGRGLSSWKLVRMIESSPRRRPPTQEAPCVGRAAEMARVHGAARAVAEIRRPQLLAVVGEAGIGKSRLAAEITASLEESHQVLSARCPPYGDGITFLPLRQIVRAAAGGTDPERIAALFDGSDDGDFVAAQLAGAIGSSEDLGTADALFPAVRSFLEVLVGRAPVVLLIDDLHWAQPTLLDLLEYLRDAVRGPLLILCLARQELLDRRPRWGDRESIETLGPLARPVLEQLVARGLRDRGLTTERHDEIVALSGGNPLFVEQVLVALSEHGDLRVPTSLDALLAARLDRLERTELDVARAASVWGTSFRPEDVADVLPEPARATLAATLDSLDSRRIIMRSDDAGTYAFRHGLIQMAAYRSITKRTRSRLHELAVEALDARPMPSREETEEIVGHHLEQAARLRSALDMDDAHTRHLARRAGEHLGRAGIRAFRRLDAMGAQTLLGRALRLLPDDHPDRRPSTRYLIECHQVMGRHDDARRLLGPLIDDVTASGDQVLAAFLRLEFLWTCLATGPDPMTLADIEVETEAARAVFSAVDDQDGLAQVGRMRWQLHRRRGDIAAMEEAAAQGLEAAGRATSSREQIAAAWFVALALAEGPRPVAACIDRCTHLDGANPGVAATLAPLYAMQGDVATARRLIGDAYRLLRERVRARRPLTFVHRSAAEVELLAGDLAAAERHVRDALGMSREQGEMEQISLNAADLTRIQVRTGRIDEAAASAVAARDHAPLESVHAQALSRSAQGLVAARRGDHGTARRLAQEARDLVPRDMLTLRGTVCRDVGEALAVGASTTESVEALQEAVEVFERKGNLAEAATVRRMLQTRSVGWMR